MEIIYHGHACIEIVTQGKSLIIDPFLSGNPKALAKPENIHTNAVLLTHAHTDHMLDAELIARNNDAPVIAIVELATYMSWQGLATTGMNIGGTVDLGFAKVTMIQALHSSGITLQDKQQIIYAGLAAGYIIRAEGLSILHTGDTGLFGDMKLIGERNHFDVALIPIGGHFTMGTDDALQAAKWLGAKLVVPMHYDTFPVIQQDASMFIQQLAEHGLNGRVLAPGTAMAVYDANRSG